MWERKELKQRAKAAFKTNYWPSVIIAFVLSILVAGETACAHNSSSSNELTDLLQGADAETLLAILIGMAVGSVLAIIIAVLIDMFITNPLKVGGYRFFIRNSSDEKPGVGMLVSAYKDGHFGKVFVTMFLTDLFLVLWSLLFVIPGIVKFYSYRMVPYILADHPEMSGTEVITMSRQMMNGQKWKAFVLDLSFIGWYILTACTLGLLGLFYVGPYVQATNAELYLALKQQ